jgi:hypothetical protein
LGGGGGSGIYHQIGAWVDPTLLCEVRCLLLHLSVPAGCMGCARHINRTQSTGIEGQLLWGISIANATDLTNWGATAAHV